MCVVERRHSVLGAPGAGQRRKNSQNTERGSVTLLRVTFLGREEIRPAWFPFEKQGIPQDEERLVARSRDTGTLNASLRQSYTPAPERSPWVTTRAATSPA